MTKKSHRETDSVATAGLARPSHGRAGMRGLVALLSILVIVGIAVYIEMRQSLLQSRFFSHIHGLLEWHTGDGGSDTVVYPNSGPYNERLGYSRLPDFIESARARGYTLERQTRFSPALLQFIAYGGYPVFAEKTRTGLTIADTDGTPLYAARYPRQMFSHFGDIPPLVLDTLLFIENRKLLEPDHPHQNPAIEWRRLASALALQSARLVVPELRADGGSTLAIQAEKYRHSEDGLTQGPVDKLRQIFIASLRAYRDGPDTSEARQRIVLDYLNSTPLAGRPGFGDIHGLGDGLWAWFGIDLQRTTELLHPVADRTGHQEARARTYRKVLALLLAQRRPSWYLRDGREQLEELTDSYLRVLHQAGVIERDLRDLALEARLDFSAAPPALGLPSFIDYKAVNSVRYQLLRTLGVSDLFALDRLDLAVETTFNPQVQDAVSLHLQQLHDREYARSQGLYGQHLFRDDDPIEHIHYSAVIYERTNRGNYLRVQADNFDQPLDMNEGTMLDLGSTAKLRTLVTYLEIVDELYQRLSRLPVADLRALTANSDDVLTSWAAARLAANPRITLSELLDAAMARDYSASPAETFYTGGGVHRFTNFDRSHNHRVISVNEAFRHSVNLVFIRLIRDIVRYELAQQPELLAVVNESDHPERELWLRRFAAMEGLVYLNQFIDIYYGLNEEERLQRLGPRVRQAPYRLAMAYRAARPEGDIAGMEQFLRRQLGSATPAATELRRLYQYYDTARFNLNDQGFLTKVHPLELWLIGYLGDNPDASRNDIRAASTDARQEVYTWLFRTSRLKAQQQRIRIMVEREVFKNIHRRWQRLGYPFPRLIPSYASAIGASADRPAALAELMGIIVNDGVRQPLVRIRSLHFAAGTPYEVRFGQHDDRREPLLREPLLAPEVAARLRLTLIDAVEEGTGRRLRNVFHDGLGQPLPVGSKTGTGDHRFKRIGRGGHVIDSEVRGRNATLMFFIGDRFFGTVAAHVAAPQAERFRFTSALPTQILRSLEPALQPLLHSTAKYPAVIESGAPVSATSSP